MLEPRAIRSVAWSLSTYGLNKAVTLGTTIVLARLLAPADFGVVALATLFISFVALFSDLGLGSALILRQDLDQRGRGTILTLMLGLSALIGVLTAISAPAVASFLNEPRLADVLFVLAFSIPLTGYNWFRDASLQRSLDFKLRFAAQTAQTAVYAGVAIATAVAGAGLWSIVCGQIAGAATYAAYLALNPSGRVKPAWDTGAARTALGTSKGFLAQGGLAFAKQNTDYLVVGRLLGAAPLGFYSMAYRLAELPYWAISDPVAKVTFPGFARMSQRGEDVAKPFLSALQLVALIACPLGVLLSGAAGPFVLGVLGEKWAPMIGPLGVLALWGVLRPIHATTGWLLNSLGCAALLARVSALLLLGLVPALLVAASLGDLTTVTLVMLAEMVVGTATLAWLAAGRAGVSLRRQWRAVRPIALACPAAWAVTQGVSELTSDLTHLLTLAIAVACGAAAYLLVVRMVEPGLPRHALAQVRRVVGRARPAPVGA